MYECVTEGCGSVLIVQGDWSEEELERLREVFAEVAVNGGDDVDEKEKMRLLTDHFPHRGIRDITRQLRQEGLLSQRKGRGKRREAEGMRGGDIITLHEV